MSANLAVAFCSGEMVHADFATSLAMLVGYTHNVAVSVINAKSSVVAGGRSECVETALENGMTHLLFIDTDQTFPPDTAMRLLKAKKKIIGATCRKRTPPHDLTHRELDGSPGVIVPTDSGLREVGSIGTGCLLIDLWVFNGLKKPFFHFNTVPDRHFPEGEDFVFCTNARAAGHSIWLDVELSREVGHIGTTVLKV